jgi:protease-4
VNVKLLIGILGRPWFIEPSAAAEYAGMAADLLRTGSMPAADKRKFYSDHLGLDFGPSFRVNEMGQLQKDGPVQVFRMNYPIAKYDYCGDPGSQTMQQLIAAADADPSVKSMVLWIDSPGGQVDGTEALANTVKAVQKPVVAYTDGLMASAAYWIGSSANEIISQGSNNGWNETIGSIGTMAMWMDQSGKYEKEGIKVHTVFATESTDKWGNFFAAQKGDYSRLVKELDGLNETFLNAVKTNRAGKLNLDKENVLTGKTYNTKEALKNGLIDRIGNFQYAVKRSLSLYKKQQANPMAFTQTLAAAKADAFAVVAEGDAAPAAGFLVSEEHLNNLEEQFTAVHKAAADANEAIKAFGAQVADLGQQLAAAQDAATASADALATANTRIAELEATAAGFTQTRKEGEEKPEGEALKGKEKYLASNKKKGWIK